jgi:hypothetical protein
VEGVEVEPGLFSNKDSFPKVHRSPSTPPHSYFSFGKGRETVASVAGKSLSAACKACKMHIQIGLLVEKHRKKWKN